MIEHGDFEITQVNSVIITKATGPWNEESTLNFSENMHRVVVSMEGQPFASIGIFYGESILIPSAEVQIRKLTKWRKEHGLQCVALVLVNELVTNNLTMQQYHKIYGDSNIEHQFFKSFEQAKEWLTERGFYF